MQRIPGIPGLQRVQLLQRIRLIVNRPARVQGELTIGIVGPHELVERIIRLVDRAEYKRRQYPPGPKVSAKNFGRDRRLPITNRWREPLPGGD